VSPVSIGVAPVYNGIRIRQVSQDPGLNRRIEIIPFNSISPGVNSLAAENKKETIFQHYMVINIKAKKFFCICIRESKDSNNRSKA